MKFLNAEIDWSCSWYASIRPIALDISDHEHWRDRLNQIATSMGLKNHRGLPLEFVPQEQLPDGEPYERFISQTAKVPTRENLHDFFNALVWLSFPNIKLRLNALQDAQIAELGIGKSRGPARDAATIFDENAALLLLEKSTHGQALLHELQQHHWQSAFFQHAERFRRCAEVWSFGHALMEKLVNPYKAITAHAWVVWVEAEFFSLNHDEKRVWIDNQVATQIAAHPISTNDYTPLPILGIPDWWKLQTEEFYGDTSAFRPKRNCSN